MVTAINNTLTPAIGNLKPATITSHLDDPKIDAAKLQAGIKDNEVHWQNWPINQKQYESNKTNELQVKDFVHASFGKEKLFTGYDFQVRIVLAHICSFCSFLKG